MATPPDLPSLLPSHKRALRREARRQWAALDLPPLSERVCDQIAALPELAEARHVLLYLATEREIVVEELAVRFPKKCWYAPRCIADFGLTIHSFTPAVTPLVWGAYGIREPDADTAAAIDPALLDLVFVPGLRFTASGDRLGHGSGYYDRFLPRLSPHCRAVGVTCDAAIVDSLPHAAWDQRVDVIVTESRIFRPVSDKEIPPSSAKV